eukprot:6072553-Lingulodinium_polyedra.AAC.1
MAAALATPVAMDHDGDQHGGAAQGSGGPGGGSTDRVNDAAIPTPAAIRSTGRGGRRPQQASTGAGSSGDGVVAMELEDRPGPGGGMSAVPTQPSA